ncbi:GAF domain-containing protein [Silvanigrella paludirubra]|uniref:GAF domain-containing protein n=1 Tax=Silvanigrella paludirubra TaxID=2499159 RepID=A0A6N6VWP2_9BACT|nr:GAF domain-containing protein [Silvanigrella paludirubra]KAB8041095.1 GAF domain-containing protein [Silvanigrella paludirubra]
MNFHPAIDITKNDEYYDNLYKMVNSYLDSENDWLAQLSNVTALLNETLPQINWVGFYLLKDNQLIVGPFQGKMACTRIALDKGVCGAAATQLKTIRVDNVHKFENHISCDSASFSEIVFPLFYPNKKATLETLIGVLDIDSPVFARFSETDEKGLEKIALLISEKVKWPNSPTL